MARSRPRKKPGPNAADVTPSSPPQHKPPPAPRPPAQGQASSPTNLSPLRAPPTTPPDSLHKTTTGGSRLRVRSRTNGDDGVNLPKLKEPFTPGGSTRYEAVGGRVQAADGTWVAYALTRPVPRPGHPKAPLLVTVNGLSNDGFQWEGLVPTLKKEHAVLSWDYRGHGCSENPRDASKVSIESLAEDMQLVLDDVDNRGLASVAHVTVVAYSMGCQVALEWCRQHAGGRLEGVALILGTPQYSLRTVMFGSKTAADLVATFLDSFQTPLALAWEVSFAWTFATSYVSHALARALGVIRIPWAAFAPFYRHLKRLHGGAYNRMLVTGQRHTAMDVLERLDRREVPTLIVTGGKDFSAGKSVFREMHFAAPRASFVHLPEACHAGMIGEREAVTEALEAFLHEKRESVAFNRRRLYDATGMNVSPPESPVKTAGGRDVVADPLSPAISPIKE